MTPETRCIIGSAELACPSLEKLHVTPSLKVWGGYQPERPRLRVRLPARYTYVCVGIPTLTPENQYADQLGACVRRM